METNNYFVLALAIFVLAHLIYDLLKRRADGYEAPLLGVYLKNESRNEDRHVYYQYLGGAIIEVYQVYYKDIKRFMREFKVPKKNLALSMEEVKADSAALFDISNLFFFLLDDGIHPEPKLVVAYRNWEHQLEISPVLDGEKADMKELDGGYISIAVRPTTVRWPALKEFSLS